MKFNKNILLLLLFIFYIIILSLFYFIVDSNLRFIILFIIILLIIYIYQINYKYLFIYIFLTFIAILTEIIFIKYLKITWFYYKKELFVIPYWLILLWFLGITLIIEFYKIIILKINI